MNDNNNREWWRKAEDNLKQQVLDAISMTCGKWVDGGFSIFRRHMSWLDMITDVAHVLSIVPYYEKMSNPQIDNQVRDVLKCDALQHMELVVDELNRVETTYSQFTVTYLSCGCMLCLGHVTNVLSMCDTHRVHYENDERDTVPVWDALFRNQNEHRENACMFKYPLDLARSTEKIAGAYLEGEQNDFTNAFNKAVANKKADINLDNLDWID